MKKGGNKGTAILLIHILAFGIFFVHNIQAPASISVTYEFETPTVEEIEGFHRVTIEGLYNLYETDKPVLPFGLARILLPQGHEIGNISIDIGEEQVLGEGFNIEIGKKPEHTCHTGTVVDHYSTFTGAYPETYFELLRTQVHKGYEIAFIRLYPVHYDGQSGRITYVNEITVTMTTSSAKKGPGNTFRGLRRDNEEVRSMVDNPWTMDTYTQKTRYPARVPFPGSYDYVIITNDTLQPTFQNLANWKNSRGISTVIVSTSYIYPNYTGTDNQEKIRNFIIDAYNNWNITYVLLGGDVEIIPHRGVYGYVMSSSGPISDTNIPCDLYYAGLSGNWNADGDTIYGEGGGGGGGASGEEADFTYEVYVGRASVSNTTETTNFINKVIAFESGPPPSLASMWGAQLDGSTWGGDHKDQISSYFPGAYFISKYYDKNGTANTTNWVASVNAGQNFVNFGGHGNTGSMTHITSGNVDTMITNTSNFCLVYSWGCYCASFDLGDCIAEHFVNNSTGAFAYVGNSRYGWYFSGSTSGTSHQFDKEFFDAIFNENILDAGHTLADSKQDRQGSVGSTGPDRWVYFELNLLGDPETPLLGVLSPALSSSISASPTTVSSGQQVTVTMTVTNTGGRQANNVTPSVLTTIPSGTASATYLSGPTPASTNIPVGGSQNFTWTYVTNAGANGGTINFRGNANGTDAGTGSPVSSPVSTSNTVTVQVPASLNANLTTNLSVASNGQNVTVNMVVSNTGQSTANNVTSSALTVTTAGAASATYVSGPTPASANIPGGTSATFSWTYTCYSGANGGTVTFSGNASGSDANSGNPITSNTTSATVKVRGPGNPAPIVRNINQQMRPVAQTHIKKAEDFIPVIRQLIDEAEAEGKNTIVAKQLLEQAEEALEKAYMYFAGGNYIAANYWAMQAIKLLEECKEYLDNL